MGGKRPAGDHAAGQLGGAAGGAGTAAGGYPAGAAGRRGGAGTDPRRRDQPRPVRHGADGALDAPALAGHTGLLPAVSGVPEGGHRLAVPVQPGHRLYPALPHRTGCEVAGRHRLRRYGYHHQSLQTGEGSPRHRRSQDSAPERLPQVPALQGERGVRGTAQPPRPAESPGHSRHHQWGGLVPPVQPLRLLQRALHRL